MTGALYQSRDGCSGNFGATILKPMPDNQPTDLRRHRAITDRNLLIGFFAILLVVGLGLIFLFYGGGAAIGGLLCLAVFAALAGLLALVMWALGKLGEWLDDSG